MEHRLAILVAAVVLMLGLTACSRTMGGSGSEETGPHSETGGGEESATQHGPGDTYDMVRAGARLILRYDSATQTFTGTVTNTTDATLSRVRIEVHLSNGVELGPTKPVDLAPGATVVVALPAPGQTFATWSAHPEVGGSGESTGRGEGGEFTPSFGGWATIEGVELGIEHQGFGLRAWFTSDGSARISPSAPQHQPTGAATWRGEWAGYYGGDPTINTGEARVTVTLSNGPKATLALDDVPTLGTLQWDNMSVSDGRFTGLATQGSSTYEATGQFGGADQAGVVGHASGSDLRSVFYGEKVE